MVKRPLFAKRVNQMLQILLEDLTVRRVTDYIAPNLTLRVSAITFKREKQRGRRSKEETIGFSIRFGKPNYIERVFIRDCKAVGTTFPIRKLQLTYMPRFKKDKFV